MKMRTWFVMVLAMGLAGGLFMACEDEGAPPVAGGPAPPTLGSPPALVAPVPGPPEPSPDNGPPTTGPDTVVDTDGDGVPDHKDPFPLDPKEWADADGDGVGDNADPDDDNDGTADLTDPDADGDGFTAAALGGDDCNDTNAQVHPGAADEPDGIASATDFNCDGVADADLAKGFLVDLYAATASDANDGSAAAPLKSIAAGVARAKASLASDPNPKPNVYLVYYPNAMLPYTISANLVLTPGIGLYGGYLPIPKGGSTRGRNLTTPTLVSLGKMQSFLLMPEPGAPATDLPVRLDGLSIGGTDTLLVMATNVHTVISRTTLHAFTEQTGTTALFYLNSGTSNTTLTLDHALVWHHGEGNAAGVLVMAVDTATAQLTVRHSTVRFDADRQPVGRAIGLLAWRDKTNAATVNVHVADSNISAGAGEWSIGLLLGDSGATLSAAGAKQAVDQVVLERNTIAGGFVNAPQGSTGYSSGVSLYNATSAVLRNNLVRGGTTRVINGFTLQSTQARAVQIVNSHAGVLNNTLRDARYTLWIDAKDKQVRLINNILAPWKHPEGLISQVALTVDSATPLTELSNNLFADDLPATFHQYFNGATKTTISSTDPKSAALLNAGQDGSGYTKFLAGGGNVVGKALLVGSGYAPGAGSAAIDKGKALTAAEKYPGEADADVAVDIAGQQRGALWEIGADEVGFAADLLKPGVKPVPLPPLKMPPLVLPKTGL